MTVETVLGILIAAAAVGFIAWKKFKKKKKDDKCC